MNGPLHGLRILELNAIGPVPFVGALLADLGADVVRTDRIAGPAPLPGMEPRFDFYNRNKRSIALDLKSNEGVDTAMRLVSEVDVLLEGFRPGVAERLGLGPQACLAVNPRLVYGRMTGWGQSGPMAQEPGHDINYLALTGALHCIGGPGRPPAPPLNLVADLGGGAMFLAVGVLAALMEAGASGHGQVVDAAMVDGVACLMSMFQALRQQGTWSAKRGENLLDGAAPFYGTYETGDGQWVAVGAIEPQFYANLIAVMGFDPESLPRQMDRASWPMMRERFAAVFRQRTRADWERAMAGREACFSPVLDIDEAWTHPHMAARETFLDFDGLRHPAPAPRFSRTPGSLRRRTPNPGAHTDEVIREWTQTRATSRGW